MKVWLKFTYRFRCKSVIYGTWVKRAYMNFWEPLAAACEVAVNTHQHWNQMWWRSWGMAIAGRHDSHLCSVPHQIARAVTHVTRTFCFILQKMCSVHPNFSPFATAHTRITASAVMARKRRSEHPTHNSLPISRKGFKNPHMRGCFGGHPCIDFRNLRPGVSDEN